MITEPTDEQAVIACAINGMVAGIKMLTDDDYLVPRHRQIAAAVVSLLNKGIGVEEITVCDELQRRGELALMGGRGTINELADLGRCYVGDNAPYYAAEVRTAARVRRLSDAARKLGASTEADRAGEYVDDMVIQFRRQLENLPPEMGGTPTSGEQFWAETIGNSPEKPEDWLIPGLLSRDDRVMVTGIEGFGKSSFVMQVAGCSAAGLNPFNAKRVSDGIRVLTIDCENPEKRIRSGVRFMGSRMGRFRPADRWGRRWAIHQRPAGINLLAARDLTEILEIAEGHQPDLIVIGPMYKLMRGGDPNKDGDMQQVQAALDEIRVKHHAAMLIEAHSGLGQGGHERPIRPRGSSVQLGWPEIGFGIRPDPRPEAAEGRQFLAPLFNNRETHMECVAWRGQREDRDWPTHIKYGLSDELPWVPTDDRWAPSVDLGYEIQPKLRRDDE